MIDRVFRDAEESDLVRALHEYWILIQEAHWLSIERIVDSEKASKINGLLQIPGILNADLSLEQPFRRVVDDIAHGRKLHEFSADDIHLVAARRNEWQGKGYANS
jgi:hypothetical protein